MRKLASIQAISEVAQIPGADAIEAVRVNGWWVVSKKGEFKVGDRCVYFEVDSFLPVRPEFEFLRKACFKSTQHLGDGFRLKTIKLRGQLSQGLALPLSTAQIGSDIEFGTDVSEMLGVKLWEKPIPPQLQGQMKGSFPSFIRKTDQERCQNLIGELREAHERGEHFEVTIKLDGSSCTAYWRDGVFGVCSRNIELKLEDETNTFVSTVERSGLGAAIRALGRNIAVQGELIGPGIQGNPEGLEEHAIYVFDIFDIDTQRYLLPSARDRLLTVLQSLGFYGWSVPVLDSACIPPRTVPELLQMAEGPSLHADAREGLVFKSIGRNFSFKAIANSYLLGEA